jgi:hypothetical protein
MSDKVKAIPEGYEGATPYLIIKGAARALEFYKNAFGASEVMRMPGPGGTVGHAEIKIGKAMIMLADEFSDMNCKESAVIRWFAGEHHGVCEGRRHVHRSSCLRRREGAQAGGKSVLRRSVVQPGRPFWASMALRDACGRRAARRDGKTCRGVQETAGRCLSHCSRYM